MNEEPKIPEIKQPVVPIKPAAKTPAPKSDMEKAKEEMFRQAKAMQSVEPPPLSVFSDLVNKAPKEHLPTMLVKLVNRCRAENIWPNSKEMADAIMGASKGVK